uniref:Importin-7/11-like TPR repeats domain-containing protein n=1 Tax=Alexandrium catenella TaxID=2925 RepID=A0A7S1LUU4_ALECA
MVSAEAAVAPLVLEVWRRCAADPLAHLQVLDLVSCATACDARLQRAMEEHLLPAVRSDLRIGTDAHLAASSIELYGVLLKRASVPLGPQLWECVDLLLPVVMRSDESGLMQNATEVLCSLVQRSPEQLSERGCLQPLLQCVERLLGPSLDDDACLHVGQLAMLVLSQFGALLPADLTLGLLRALVARLVRAERPYLRQELVVVVARLLCQDLHGTLTALSGMMVAAADGSSRGGLEALLSTWLEISKEIRAKRARSITVSALCRLHERCLEDGHLQAMRVRDAPMAEQLLGAIVAGLEFENERCQRLREAKLDMGSDDDDEEAEDDEDDDGLGGPGGGGKLLSELLDLDDFEELSDASEEEGELAAPQGDDPFRSLDVRRVAAEYLAAHTQCAAEPSGLATRLRAAVEDVRAHP